MVKSQPIMRYILRLIPAVAAALMLSACSSSNTSNLQNAQTEMRAVNDKNGLLLQASQDEFEAMVRNVDIKSKILEQYAGWKGVRYRLGGSSKRGIDCSAFVQLTFREQFGMDLPRSTSEQQDIGKTIQRTKLRPGDLVLFRAGSTGRHVGIYLGNDKFVHASTSIGVTISNLSDKYWNKRYQDGRRVLSARTQS
ncbi:bifunctional murein DD-endopeptidase/murein LD-carboxypeptidase [Yersinia ruckeri]|uniref:bifunctional murein DD-endopeptidase/murein LD-carboxypeptidase n=1 Tax=Yersinia ruckeri TaxID=29486 RepID=UPI002238BA36|nr:bifunctional murein DD-endopeptidase/murein LD-carboxypeptidase [Yersinia ruckeri]MCW6565086.1 bifunctional murein DD-endopeptidase/murein LD-carboxypeptidase [Yersinia ruckeri]MCW6573795.1 bifunctional murein DD-endopeptidase/murein LD-carboxypeptidase [Yersinia ruckeri]MCW6599407.1 bifunctional murein DD-endopeptidase/murein LD-carboxypeptidase [Yersinia ruckeri]MCW6608894.1 bifunctional murein DD-endopeptidase/murein LD-carboxypeptidase [Yersinia ruckeri]MCW6615455.1 bifunctional murein 